MKIQTSVQETSETTTTQKIELAPGVYAVRTTVVRRRAAPPEVSRSSVETTDVSEFMQHTIETSDQHFGEFRVVEPELLERLQRNGWFREDKDWELISKQPFTRVQEATYRTAPYRVVRLRTYDGSLFDTDGQRLPVAMSYNYIDGRVSDYNFDLKRLLAHLLQREDVTLHKERFNDGFISRIPHYNAGDTTGYHALTFTWHPDVELFRQYCALAAKLDHFDRHAAAHQLMGNDQFRVEPPKVDEGEGEGGE